VLGELTIESTPAGALILIDGNLVGQTPMAWMKIAKGTHQIRLILPGYKDWTMQIAVDAGESKRIAANLVPIWMKMAPHAEFRYFPPNPRVGEIITFDASVSFDFDGFIVRHEWYFDDGGFAIGPRATHVFSAPGNFTVKLIVIDNEGLSSFYRQTITVTVKQPQQPPTANLSSPPLTIPVEHLFLGLNAGTNSVGAELGFDLGTGALSLGGSVSLTGEEVPKYFDVGSRQEFEREKIYNDGPETELYIKGGLPILERVFFEVGLGLSAQDRVHIATPLQAARLGEAIKLDIEVLPNGYKETKLYLTVLGGLAVHFGNIFLSFDYHTRRGWIAGIGFSW